MYKEVLPLDNQKADNVTMEQSKALVPPDRRLFHYTSREVFWKIMEDETFLARHILFSNDYEEYELGRKKIDSAILELGFKGNVEEAEDNERYMICFCEEDDLLSQWRGYAQNGIAMEFDFSLGLYGYNDGSSGTVFSPFHCFSLINNDKAMKKKTDAKEPALEPFEKRYVSKEERSPEKFVSLCITAPYKVFYVGKKVSESLKRAIVGLKSLDAPVMRLIKLIPYIKNKKFDEEKEYRLIFDLADLFKSDTEWIRDDKNIYLDVEGVKKPNIRVEFGNALERLNDDIRLFYRNDTYTGLLERFRDKLKSDKKLEVKLELVADTALGENEILLGNGKNQEAVMRRLSAYMQASADIFQDTKIWCDGRLPIRRVIVGPSKDAELMKKSIIQYKHNKYWMKYVEVVTSDIPFRS